LLEFSIKSFPAEQLSEGEVEPHPYELRMQIKMRSQGFGVESRGLGTTFVSVFFVAGPADLNF